MDKSKPQNKQLWAVLSAVLCFLVLSVGYTVPTNIYRANYNAKHYRGQTSTTTLEQSDSTVSQSNTERQSYVEGQSQSSANGSDASPLESYSTSANGQGQYTFASERLLTEEDLIGLTGRDLKIMRNEIFARHGYIFKTEDMKAHFNSQPWYEGKYDDVSSMLSDIEVKNVSFIKKHE